MTNVLDAETVLETAARSTSVRLGEWAVDAATLEVEGSGIDEVLANGGTFFGREVVNAWRFLPANGWRLIFEDPATRVFAAPEPDVPGEWAVASLHFETGVWRAVGAERNVLPHAPGIASAKALELTWPGDQVIVRGRTPRLFAKVTNTGAEPWAADGEDALAVLGWLIELPSGRRLLASRPEELPAPREGGKSILVPPSASIVVPVTLATIAPESLVEGTYGIVGRLERLDLTSPTGTVLIVER